jgi:hypothetical protein
MSAADGEAPQYAREGREGDKLVVAIREAAFVKPSEVW